MNSTLSSLSASPSTVAFGSEAVAARAAESSAYGRRHVLVLRFAAFNLAAFALLGAAYLQGWLGIIMKADSTYLSLGIFLVFLGGFALCARQIWKISVETGWLGAPRPPERSIAHEYLADIADRDAGSRAIVAGALKTRLASRISIVRYVANSLVLLGLIGTVLGFVMALSAVDAEGAKDVSNVPTMVGQLIQGMYVALYTTLVGAVLHLWLSANYHMLMVGASRYARHLIARGEGSARGR